MMASDKRDRSRRASPERRGWGDDAAARGDDGHGASAAWGRTAAFLAAGAAMLVAGFAVQPRQVQQVVKPEAERDLFPELTDVQKVAALEIVKYDEELATLQPFKVVQTGGLWVLPSHENYPADARDHLAAAATELVDLKSLDVVSTSPADHETYGVIEPDPEKIKPGMTGVGELIEIRDGSGAKIARLVVGKEDKRPGAVPGQGKKLRFVRKAGQDPVYRVEIDTSKFTTRFDDWIEKDLLKLSPWDVRRVTLDDYTLGAVESGGRLRVVQDRKDKIEVAYDDKDAKWSLVRLEAYGGGAQPKEETLADGEELAATRLNDLRNALGDIKIADVRRKPAGLSADLKAEEKFTGDEEAVNSMRERGYLPRESGDILSIDGETIIGMKDGVEYVLRFGAPTSLGGDLAGKAAEDDTETEEQKDTSGRFLLVMARFNESLLSKPVLDPLPEETPAGAPAATEGAPAAADAAPPVEGGAADLLKAADEAEAKAQAALEERRRVERENRRRQDEYDDTVKAAQKRVRELNGRFADWYYVVPSKEYSKVHLDRAAIVQPKGATPAAGGPPLPGGAFPPGGGFPPGGAFPPGGPPAPPAPVRGPAKETPPSAAPASDAPATEPPATETPATETPATETPATETPATEPPVDTPAADAPAPDAPPADAPAASEPAPAEAAPQGGS